MPFQKYFKFFSHIPCYKMKDSEICRENCLLISSCPPPSLDNMYVFSLVEKELTSHSEGHRIILQWDVSIDVQYWQTCKLVGCIIHRPSCKSYISAVRI
jgi:hypothetical protein